MTDNNPDNDKFEELCAGYVLHTLGAEEQREFEAMLQEATDSQRRLYQKLRSAAAQLSFAIEGSEPSEDLKDQLMERIDAESSGRGSKDKIIPVEENDRPPAAEGNVDWFSSLSLAWAAAFALLVIVLSLIFYSFNLSTQLNQKEDELSDQQDLIAELRSDLREKEEMLSVLEADDLTVVPLRGMESNPGGNGRIIFDTGTGRILLQVSNMPPAPGDSEYQLWLIRNNEHISAGTFGSDNTDSRYYLFEGLNDLDQQNVEAFSVTLEPGGGASLPTGDTYLMGAVN